ncbi:MAG: Alpha/beta hydrolase fold protein [Methanomicrobiales archaeon 53_19]|nr:MAG: Alpha/beta hydrolase fold protein [Methanomicrobiales archaeon 53_19]
MGDRPPADSHLDLQVISLLECLHVPLENSVIIADAIPDTTLIIRKGQAHGMIFVEPEEISGIIEDFLG